MKIEYLSQVVGGIKWNNYRKQQNKTLSKWPIKGIIIINSLKNIIFVSLVNLDEEQIHIVC